MIKWDRVFKSGLIKFCGKHPLKNLIGLLLNTLPQISHDNSRVLRRIDIKKEIRDEFKNQLGFCKQSDKCTSHTTECAFCANESILHNAINATVTVEGISNC